MPAWDQGLGGTHRQIAESDERRIHILAGPGTGKTFAMMRRIARLLENGTPPERILAISFTRTAAEDLRHQLANLGVPDSQNVKACTLHALCFEILSKEEIFQYTGRTPRPILSHEVDQLFEDLAGMFDSGRDKRRVKKLLEAYEASWARLQQDEPGAPVDEEARTFQAKLLDWLRFHKCMLIGELIPLTLEFIRNNPAIPILPPFDHVLVDEYQDLNRADQALVVELSKNGHLVVVGDDNQSIYSFRHANPEGIRTFPEEYAPCARFELSECKRCPPNIVELSNALISNDSGRSRTVPLTPDSSLTSANLWFVQHSDIEVEANAVADYIRTYLDRNTELPPGQVLVLAPRRAFGNAVKRALIDRGLNALSYFTEDLLKTEQAAVGFTLLTLLANSSDRAAVRAWLGLGAGSGGYASSYARLRGYAEQSSTDIRDCLDLLADGKISIPYTNGLTQRWKDLKEKLASFAGMSPLEAVRLAWPAEAMDAADLRLIAESLALQSETIGSLVEALREVITQPTLPRADGNIIRVMSLHKSKGLTAAVVVVVGCVVGAIPMLDEDDEPEIQQRQLDEQRRLFYVALTRATRTLVLSASVAIPVQVALRAKLPVIRPINRNGERFTQLAMTPFLNEVGSSAPGVISSGDWRRLDNF